MNDLTEKEKVVKELLFLLVTVGSRTLFPFVCCYLMSFSLFTTWHNAKFSD